MKFNLKPTSLDKLKGNIVNVKYSGLKEFAKVFEKISEENIELKEKLEILEKENQELKRRLNKEILSEELGPDSEIVKMEKENKTLKEKLDNIQKSFKVMEKLYLSEIKDLKETLLSVKKECKENNGISKIIKSTIREEFDKLNEPVKDCDFEINIKG